jgi:lipopolysaccharide exporter
MNLNPWHISSLDDRSVSFSLLRRLKELALRDTNVVVISVILINLLRALSSVVLTRLLVPEVFGISGVIASITISFAMVSDLGFQAFVVRHPDGDKPRFLDTIWTMAVFRSFILSGVVFALAPTLAGMFGKKELTPIIEVASLIFLLEGCASLTLLTALRHRMVLRLSMIELALLVIQILLSFLLAYLWKSYWAILVSMLVSSALKNLFSYILFPNSVRRPAFDTKYMRELWGFARFVTSSSIITLLLLQSDKFILGRLMPLDHFGFYMLASNLATAPMAFTAAYTSRVLFPYYSQAWHNREENLRGLFYGKRRLPSLLYTFAAGGLIGSAPLVVAILYDPRYDTAALYLQILGITPLLALASGSGNEILVAMGHIKATFQANVARLSWFCIAGPIGYTLGGVLGLVTAIGLMEIPAVILKWTLLYRLRLLDLRQEFMFLGAGAVGIGVGMVGSLLIRPLV